MSKVPLLLLGTAIMGISLFLLGVRVGRTPSPVAASALRPAQSDELANSPPIMVAGVAAPGTQPAVPQAEPPAASPPLPAAGSESPPPPAEVERLENAVTSYEAAGLPVVAGYLTHAHPALRQAALEGMLQMGLSEAAPLLREAAGKAKDPREAIAMLDAADFLELPSVNLRAGPPRPVSPPPAREGRDTRPPPRPRGSGAP